MLMIIHIPPLKVLGGPISLIWLEARFLEHASHASPPMDVADWPLPYLYLATRSLESTTHPHTTPNFDLQVTTINND